MSQERQKYERKDNRLCQARLPGWERLKKERKVLAGRKLGEEKVESWGQEKIARREDQYQHPGQSQIRTRLKGQENIRLKLGKNLKEVVENQQPGQPMIWVELRGQAIEDKAEEEGVSSVPKDAGVTRTTALVSPRGNKSLSRAGIAK